MGKIKSARSGEYVITCNEEGSIKVYKDFDNDKGALREIAASINFTYDPEWTTRQFGKNLIEKITGEHVATKDAACAESGEYAIYKEESGTIQVYKNYDNTKGALREISAKIGFKYDTEWTTRQFGNKLIAELNK